VSHASEEDYSGRVHCRVRHSGKIWGTIRHCGDMWGTTTDPTVATCGGQAPTPQLRHLGDNQAEGRHVGGRHVGPRLLQSPQHSIDYLASIISCVKRGGCVRLWHDGGHDGQGSGGAGSHAG